VTTWENNIIVITTAESAVACYIVYLLYVIH